MGAKSATTPTNESTSSRLRTVGKNSDRRIVNERPFSQKFHKSAQIATMLLHKYNNHKMHSDQARGWEELMKIIDALNEFDSALYSEVKPATREWYQRVLQSLPQILGDMEIADITPHHLRTWRRIQFEKINRLGKHYSDSTKNDFTTAVKRFFSWLVDERVIDHSPAASLRHIPIDHSETKMISNNDFLAILNAANSERNLRDVAIILFLRGTGCRVNGLCQLELQDVDLNKAKAYVREKSRFVTGKGRWLTLDPVLVDAITNYVQHGRPQTHYPNLFLGRQGPLSRHAIWYILRKYAKEANVTGPHNPHAFRHAYARDMLLDGASLSMVSKLLGHSAITITHRFYARWQPDELEYIHLKHSPLRQLEPPESRPKQTQLEYLSS